MLFAIKYANKQNSTEEIVKKKFLSKNCQSKKRFGTFSNYERQPDKLFQIKLSFMDFVNSVYWGKESRPKKILQKIENVKIYPDPIDKVD